ncbi:hypothetical protein CFC21_070020 [Triticum aestivum]|uniref:Uncharacterized protein n=2 Tax=Triticum aestivum TaxID=4565 RepID=A0A3B6LGR2_WHEAT|nr:hypothetical protein CFC21_070020 [Triticum aestivum]
MDRWGRISNPSPLRSIFLYNQPSLQLIFPLSLSYKQLGARIQLQSGLALPIYHPPPRKCSRDISLTDKRIPLYVSTVAMEMERSLWLAVLIPAIMVSFYGEAAMADAQTSPDTNVLCVSKCGTCPTVCTTPPPPPAAGGDGSGYSSPSPPRSMTTQPSPAAVPQPQAKGGSPSGYYYFFTAGSGRSCATSSVRYTLLLLALLPIVAV